MAPTPFWVIRFLRVRPWQCYIHSLYWFSSLTKGKRMMVTILMGEDWSWYAAHSVRMLLRGVMSYMISVCPPALPLEQEGSKTAVAFAMPAEVGALGSGDAGGQSRLMHICVIHATPDLWATSRQHMSSKESMLLILGHHQMEQASLRSILHPFLLSSLPLSLLSFLLPSFLSFLLPSLFPSLLPSYLFSLPSSFPIFLPSLPPFLLPPHFLQHGVTMSSDWLSSYPCSVLAT